MHNYINNIFGFPDISSAFAFAKDNVFDVSPGSIFKDYTNILDLIGNYKKNKLRILPNSPAKNAGTDGTDIGIYGGPRPWREGALSSNPHIQSKTIAPETDAQGRLNVNIRVKAQGN